MELTSQKMMKKWLIPMQWRESNLILDDDVEFDTREGEKWSDKDLDKESVKSTNTEISNSKDFIPVSPCRRAVIKPKRYHDKAYLRLT